MAKIANCLSYHQHIHRKPLTAANLGHRFDPFDSKSFDPCPVPRKRNSRTPDPWHLTPPPCAIPPWPSSPLDKQACLRPGSRWRPINLLKIGRLCLTFLSKSYRQETVARDFRFPSAPWGRFSNRGLHGVDLSCRSAALC